MKEQPAAACLHSGRTTPRGVRTIAASRGVESSARSAQVRGYNVAFAVDAISDVHQPSFDYSTGVMFPRLGQVGTTETVVAALRR